MSVQVMLMADVKDLGIEGDVVSVTAGHARNYLFPRKLAAKVTAETQKRLEKIRREREVKRLAVVAAAQQMAAKLAGVSCTLPVKVSEGERLFGSVTEADIVTALHAQGVEVEKSQVLLAKPIKELGVYDIPVQIHPEVSATIKVWVVEE